MWPLAFGLGDGSSQFVDIRVIRLDLYDAIELLPSQRSLSTFGVGESEVVVEERIVRLFFHRFFEEGNRGSVDRLVVKSPSQSIGGIRIVGELTASGLRHGEGDIYIPTLLQHDVGEVIGGQRIVGLNFKSLLILLLGMIPILFVLVDAAGEKVEVNFFGISF